jgi:hypothetical protein
MFPVEADPVAQRIRARGNEPLVLKDGHLCHYSRKI